MEELRFPDPETFRFNDYKCHLADCVIVTHDYKVLMQRRPLDWGQFGGMINIFGGHVEEGETIQEALIRELNEETGAIIFPEDIINIGIITEGFTGHTEAVHIHFWHDQKNSITGCYEAEAIEFDSVHEAISHPNIMPYAKWALQECERRCFFPSNLLEFN